MFNKNKTTFKLIVILLILVFTIQISLQNAAQADVASDFLQLDGLEGAIVDGSITLILNTAGCGGAVFELGNSIYDAQKGLIKVMGGEATTMDYIDLGVNVASAGVIIAALATGGAAIPILVAATVGVKIFKELVKNYKVFKATPKAIKKIASWLKKHIGNPILNFLGVYKPNIYIYSKKDINVCVKLEPSEYITKSDPPYNLVQGWKSSVWNGSINGCNDFLFYEARIPEKGLQTEEAFIVRGALLKKDMELILDLYGFNQIEKDDFLTYWVEQLSTQKDYVFYPQGGDILQEIMPLTVLPTPDHIFRLWFLIREADTMQINAGSLPFKILNEVERIQRLDYTVVEWGGIMEEPVSED